MAKITPCFENGKGAIALGLLRGVGFGTTELHVLRPSALIDSRFLYYVTTSHLFRVAGAASMYGAAGQQRVGESFIRNFLVGLPPRDLQRRIAAHLDRKTAAVDDLIAKKERLIELLEEKRQAVITQAVTKGLDPSVPKKDSGLDWVGAIPRHWSVARISYLSRVTNGTTPDRSEPEYWTDGTVPWLSSGKVNDHVVLVADEFITARALGECSLELLPPGSVLVGMIGQGKTRGMSAITRIAATINQNTAGIVVGPRLDEKFLLSVLTAAYVPLREFGRGGQQDALNCQIIGAFPIPLPTIGEQRKIVDLIEAASSDGRSAVEKLKLQADRLREYRQALITAAVTGQIDVEALASDRDDVVEAEKTDG